MDNCDGHGDYFLSRDEVNAWSKEAIGNMIVTDAKDTEGNPYMVQSGELLFRAKYLLAITDKIIKGLGQDLMCGYDVGCKFGTTITKSPLGVLAAEQNHTTVVGAFHGHAHCQICQICKLPLYTDGQGLTDHEECKRYFSESNALASSTRYASHFHRMQVIVQWMKRKDCVDTYSRLSPINYGNNSGVTRHYDQIEYSE
ncbi:hypothetical protein ARMGADRAFT_1022949 [Armillaria gallica]|uniref:Uncharacterized protein n=1 Tax=Armillaria gallica TaxID=47427 RepID=A0A2H3EW72_ARMGA|nr:hypothetical protein ARMGADRAFT_1022949 [Armillaria gallica]